MTHESTAAWRELLETLGGLDRSFLEGDRAVTDDRHIADGYRMLATTLGVAFDTYLFADPSRPKWVEVNSPFRPDRRWGGDNTDAYYFMCPVDPKRRYRISGNRGDSVYFSVTAYNEPSPGAWSDRTGRKRGGHFPQRRICTVSDGNVLEGDDGDAFTQIDVLQRIHHHLGVEWPPIVLVHPAVDREDRIGNRPLLEEVS